jgi:hypothetical protein
MQGTKPKMIEGKINRSKIEDGTNQEQDPVKVESEENLAKSPSAELKGKEMVTIFSSDSTSTNISHLLTGMMQQTTEMKVNKFEIVRSVSNALREVILFNEILDASNKGPSLAENGRATKSAEGGAGVAEGT